MLRLITGVGFVTWIAAMALGQAPLGDYGDAPDSPTQHFPTDYMTFNSRLGFNGVHHLITGQEMLGTGVSSEFGAQDPLDPDGVMNLVNMDGYDEGLIGLMVTTYGSPFQIPLSKFSALLDITISPAAPAGRRYLNILVDADRDQEWKNTAAYQEWAVVNLPVEVLPGATQRIMVPLGIFPDPTKPNAPSAEMWMRVTLSRTPIDTSSLTGQGGWDGSGSFDFGETEDYLLYYPPAPGQPGTTPGVPILPFPPPSGVHFDADCIPQVLKLDHRGPAGTMKCRVKVRDFTGLGASAALREIVPDQIGPMTGAGVVNGTQPGNIGAVTVTPTGGGSIDIDVKINPILDPPSRIQSFGVRFRLDGFNSVGSKIWARSKTCDVLIYHDVDPIWVWFTIAANAFPPGMPVPLTPIGGGPPIGYVTFGNNQPTPGIISAVQIPQRPPVSPEPNGDTVRISSFFDVFLESNEIIDETTPEVETVISGLTLAGYTDALLEEQNILADETLLQPIKMSYYSDSFLTLDQVLTTDVGMPTFVDPIENLITIMNPTGFSVWGIQGILARPCDYNRDNRVDAIDFDTFSACYNGPTNPVSGDCLKVDVNGDNFVDAVDFDKFSGCYNGPTNPPRC